MLTVRAFDLLQISDVEQYWKNIEKRAEPISYFLSWDWIGSWVNTCKPSGFFIVGFDEAEPVAIGFIGTPDNNGIGWLNKAGIDKKDQVWIEYNDFFITADNKTKIRQFMVSFLLNNKTFGLKKLHIDMTTLALKDYGQNGYIKLVSDGYLQRLKDVQGLSQLLNKYSKNTKRQIKKSEDLLKQTGELKLEVLSEDKQADVLLNEISELHKSQWVDSKWGSGFTNEEFVKCHQQLITLPSTKILCLTCDGIPIAYGYFLLSGGSVNFYLSAIDKNPDNKIKVGLLFHCYAMLHFSKQGFKIYDFLAGDARYKKSLSSEHYRLNSLVIYGDSWSNKLEKMVRKIRSIIRRDKEVE